MHRVNDPEWRCFWFRRDIQHFHAMMNYHKKQVMAGKEHVHGGTTNMEKFWYYQSLFLHEWDVYRKERMKNTFKIKLVPVFKPETKAIKEIKMQPEVAPVIEWVPAPLCWD